MVFSVRTEPYLCFSVFEYSRQCRQTEGQRLSRSRLRDTDNIPPSVQHRPAVALNRRRPLPILLPYVCHHYRRHLRGSEIFEGSDRHAFHAYSRRGTSTGDRLGNLCLLRNLLLLVLLLDLRNRATHVEGFQEVRMEKGARGTATNQIKRGIWEVYDKRFQKTGKRWDNAHFSKRGSSVNRLL